MAASRMPKPSSKPETAQAICELRARMANDRLKTATGTQGQGTVQNPKFTPF